MERRDHQRKELPVDLPTLQRWMQAVITHPGGVSEGIGSPDATAFIDVTLAGAESVITPSEKRTSLERLGVYSHAYFARLSECLESIFPVFAQVVGHETFQQFALTYLGQYPSRTYTLNELGRHFVPFLEETKPRDQRQGWEDFLIELAQLEWAIDRVFDGPGFEGQPHVTSQTLEAISPDVFWECRVTLVPCLRLLDFAFPVSAFLTSFRQDNQTTIPEPEPTWLALTRRQFIVRRVPLTRFQWQVLRNLADRQTVGQAIESALPCLSETEQPTEVLAAAFQKFAAEQLFLAISS